MDKSTNKPDNASDRGITAQDFFVQVHCPMLKAAVRIQCEGDTSVEDILNAAAQKLGVEWKEGWIAASSLSRCLDSMRKYRGSGMQLRPSDVIGPDGKLKTRIGGDELRILQEGGYNSKIHRLVGDIIATDSSRRYGVNP